MSIIHSIVHAIAISLSQKWAKSTLRQNKKLLGANEVRQHAQVLSLLGEGRGVGFLLFP